MCISIVEMTKQLSQGHITKSNNVIKPELELSSPYCLPELLSQVVVGGGIGVQELCSLQSRHKAQTWVLLSHHHFFLLSTTLNEYVAYMLDIKGRMAPR